MKNLKVRLPLVIISLFFLISCTKNESGTVTVIPVASSRAGVLARDVAYYGAISVIDQTQRPQPCSKAR